MTNERFFKPELDGLRFIAFLLIFIHHTDYTDFIFLNYFKEIGWLGVDVFFCLSAYLLTRLLVVEYEKNNDINVVNFFVRRLLRIWPLYFSYVFLATLLFVYSHRINELNWLRLIGLVTFTDNFFGAAQGVFNPIRYTGHLWTISYEEQFYLFLPFLIIFLKRKSLRNSILVLTLLIAIGSVVRLVFIYYKIAHPAIWVLPVTHFESILVGVLLGRFDFKLISYPLKFWIASFFISLLIIGFLSGTGKVTSQLMILYPCVGIFSGSVLLIALHSRGAIWQFLSNRWMIYLGKISYGLYVFHNLCFAIVDHYSRWYSIETQVLIILLSLLLTIIVSSLSYEMLEKKFLLLKRRFTTILSRPV